MLRALTSSLEPLTMSSRLRMVLVCAFALTVLAPEAGAIRNGRRVDLGIANQFGVAGIDNFSEFSGLLWELDFEIYLPHNITLIPYMQFSQEFREDSTGQDTQFGGFGVLVRYSILMGVVEPFVLGGLSVPILGSIDTGAGPTVGFGVVINPMPQLGIVVQAFYMLVFGGEEEQLGDGVPGVTSGLAFRW